MPELPEVETMVRGVRPSMEGRTLVELRVVDRGYRPLTMLPSTAEVCRRVAGARIARVWRLGKRVVLDFGDRGTLAIEPRMTGLMLTSDPPSLEHLRLEFLLRDASSPSAADPFSVWFWDRRGLGTITWRAAGEIDELIRQRKLGPDALTLDAAQWKAALGVTSRAVKVALLDQKLVAGVGNLYASEILHLAGISPLLAASKLTQAQWERLAEAARKVLELAILHEGSTLSDGTYRNALNKAGGYQNSHRVYAKAGEACQTCREGLIERIVQAQRSTFYCGSCQALKVKRRRKT